jgi:hypothetical protein
MHMTSLTLNHTRETKIITVWGQGLDTFENPPLLLVARVTPDGDLSVMTSISGICLQKEKEGRHTLEPLVALPTPQLTVTPPSLILHEQAVNSNFLSKRPQSLRVSSIAAPDSPDKIARRKNGDDITSPGSLQVQTGRGGNRLRLAV